VGDHTVELALYPAPGGTPSTATVNITNVDQPGSIQFQAPAMSVRTKPSGVTTFSLSVLRGAGGASGVTVDFAATDGTATSPDDYSVVTSPATLTFGARQASARITLQIRRQTHPSNPTFTVTLSNPGSGATLGAKTTEIVTIVER
jgi:Calx-beta domain